ncbi:multiple monosaccharide ABC transporter permease [Alkalibacterium sp. f15]|uniref:multiple monosaccharide ABC transporter permease n=1 Tax=Alkalibacterium sp. f15 TaxID=3414029 RepID=UPI003BF8BB55
MQTQEAIKNSGLNKEENSIRNSAKKFLVNNSMYIFLALIIILFQILTDGILLLPMNITNVILQNSYIFILTIGMLMLVLLGDIDLSVGSVLAFTGALSAVLIIENNMNVYLAIFICLLVGLLIGAWHGFWVAYVHVPAFIATLAGLLTFRGLTIVILDGQTISSYPRAFQLMSSGFLTDAFTDNPFMLTLGLGFIFVALYVFMSIRSRMKDLKFGANTESNTRFILKITAFSLAILWMFYTFGNYEGIPNVLIILSILGLAAKFITDRTTIGRHIYAIGGNEKAATLSGINTKRVKFWTFASMGVMSAIAGMVFSARLNAASAQAGSGFELDAIAACYIGGASTSGGIGTVVGALVGALVMALLNNGMSLMGVGTDWQMAIKGLVLLFAVAIDIYNKNKG